MVRTQSWRSSYSHLGRDHTRILSGFGCTVLTVLNNLFFPGVGGSGVPKTALWWDTTVFLSGACYSVGLNTITVQYYPCLYMRDGPYPFLGPRINDVITVRY